MNIKFKHFKHNLIVFVQIILIYFYYNFFSFINIKTFFYISCQFIFSSHAINQLLSSGCVDKQKHIITVCEQGVHCDI